MIWAPKSIWGSQYPEWFGQSILGDLRSPHHPTSFFPLTSVELLWGKSRGKSTSNVIETLDVFCDFQFISGLKIFECKESCLGFGKDRRICGRYDSEIEIFHWQIDHGPAGLGFSEKTPPCWTRPGRTHSWSTHWAREKRTKNKRHQGASPAYEEWPH